MSTEKLWQTELEALRKTLKQQTETIALLEQQLYNERLKNRNLDGLHRALNNTQKSIED